MSDIAIRVENLSKLYPAPSLRAGHIGARQERHDTLRDALVARFRRADPSTHSQSTNSHDTDLWALCDVSTEPTNVRAETCFNRSSPRLGEDVNI